MHQQHGFSTTSSLAAAAVWREQQPQERTFDIMCMNACWNPQAATAGNCKHCSMAGAIGSQQWTFGNICMDAQLNP
jgi:hypothetical protein